MSRYKVQPPNNGKSSGSDVKDPFKWPPETVKKIIIVSAAGGSALLVIGIIIATLLAGAVAFGAMGLIADSRAVIDDAKIIIDSNNVAILIDDDQQDDSVNPDDDVNLDDTPDPVDKEIPNAYDNSGAYPIPSSQGKQSSCTAWATAYYLKSSQEKAEHGWEFDPTSIFSPAYVYNQINGGEDAGSCISVAMNLITEQGVCVLSEMPYNDNNYRTKPNNTQVSEAFPYRAKAWFTVDGVDQIKLAIIGYGGVVIGVNIYPDFNELNGNNPIYNIQSGKNYGGHAICLVGYDDKKSAFKFINSWGTNWGLDGFGWVSYDIVERDTQFYGAFTMMDMEEVSP